MEILGQTDLTFEFSDETGVDRSESQFKAMVEEIREVVHKYGYDISGYGPTIISYLILWYGNNDPDAFPGLDSLIAEKFKDADMSRPMPAADSIVGGKDE